VRGSEATSKTEGSWTGIRNHAEPIGPECTAESEIDPIACQSSKDLVDQYGLDQNARPRLRIVLKRHRKMGTKRGPRRPEQPAPMPPATCSRSLHRPAEDIRW
jgi:hypothetical protein